MKLLFKLLPVFLLIIATSCDKEKSLIEGTVNEDTTNQEHFRKALKEQNLGDKFNLNEEVYEEFVNTAIFDENGNLRSAIYANIENELNDSESDKFWGEFGFSIRNSHNSSLNDRLNKAAEPILYIGYTSRRFGSGCKKKQNWICVISTE